MNLGNCLFLFIFVVLVEIPLLFHGEVMGKLQVLKDDTI